MKSKDVNKEAKVLDELATANMVESSTRVLQGILKGIVLLVKLVRDVRINQTTTMKFYKIPLVESEDEKHDGAVEFKPPIKK